MKHSTDDLRQRSYNIKNPEQARDLYRDWAGSYDQLLNRLIDHVMFQDEIYKELLTDEQYKSCKKVVEKEQRS